MFDNKTITTSELPALFVTGIVPLPHNDIRIDISSNMNIAAVKEAEQYRNYICIIVQKGESIKVTDPNNNTALCLIAKVNMNFGVGTKVRRLRIETIVRCKVNEYIQVKPFPIVNITTVPSIYGESTEEQILLNKIKEAYLSEINKDYKIDWNNAELVSDLLPTTLKLTHEQKIKLLETPEINERLLIIYDAVNTSKLYKQIDMKIENDVRKSVEASQKEYYLREKMHAIQDELGDKAKKESDIEKIRKQIEDSKMPEATKKRANSELNRYQSIPGASPESAITKTYLDFLLGLPWNEYTEDSNDIVNAKQILDEDHYGLDKVKDRILEYLAVKIMTGRNPQAILCLVGPPGVGKTSLAKSIARALNKKFVKLSLGGVHDESEIRGHRRTYVGALPGRILQSISKAKTSNPVFLLDEIDKMSSDYKGDPTSAMLEVLDSEQNQFFSDHYLEESFDLSKVFFIATANYLGNIPAPLRDRMEIVNVSSYTEYEKFSIAKIHLVDKQLNQHGLDKEKFSISDQAIYQIIQMYTKEAGVRELERLIGSIVRKSIKKILMDKQERVDVTVDNLSEFLGKEKFTYTKSEEEDFVGVVNGLAYTEYGGDTLQIEVTMYKGEGRLVLTGKLGDVMKESAQAALSYVKSNCEKFKIDYSTFKENDIHIHIPEGAIPKDGPSAGVTLATAIISCASGKLVNHAVGMTGEITLRGRVLPIGGLREKSIAAHRSGLKKILIPKDNVRDLDEVPESVKNNLEIVPVSSIDEVAEIAIKWN